MLSKILKRVLLSMTALLLLHTSYAQNEYEEEARKRAKNKIIKMYQYQVDLRTADSVLYAIRNYNERGQLVLYSSIDQKGKVNSRQIFTIDSNGYEAGLLAEDKDGKRTYRYVYVNDLNGNRIESIQFGAHDSIRYDPQRRVYNSKNENTALYNYNKSLGRFYLDSKYEFTKSGKYNRILRYSPSDSTVPKTINVYEYDKKDNLIAVYDLQGDSKIQLSSYIYDKRKNLVKSVKLKKADHYKDGKTIYKTSDNVVTFSYDRNDNLMEELHFTAGIKTKHIAYRYETAD